MNDDWYWGIAHGATSHHRYGYGQSGDDYFYNPDVLAGYNNRSGMTEFNTSVVPMKVRDTTYSAAPAPAIVGGFRKSNDHI